VYADDFMRRFDAEGMLLRVDDVSGSKTGLREYLTKEIGLPESETGAVWVMLDGEAPVSRLWDFAVSVAALLVLLGAAAGLLLAVRARNRVVAASRQAL
jgi:hypothetical protein